MIGQGPLKKFTREPVRLNERGWLPLHPQHKRRERERERDYRYSRKKVIANYSKWNIYAAPFCTPRHPPFWPNMLYPPRFSHPMRILFLPLPNNFFDFWPTLSVFEQKNTLFFVCSAFVVGRSGRRENSWKIKLLLGKKNIFSWNPHYLLLCISLGLIKWNKKG